MGEPVAGVCPDGSGFIVQQKKDAPCRNPHFVHPTEMPPLRPDLLPKPYMWYVDQEHRNTNNPYYLVQQAQRLRALRAEQAQAALAPKARTVAGPPSGAGVDGTEVAAPQVHRPDFGFEDSELGDLVKLIALRQNVAPATLAVKDAHGRDEMRIRFAHSDGFEQRILRQLGSDPSQHRVLAFYARAVMDTKFHPNFLVVQDGRTFRPEKSDPDEVGILVGDAGTLDGGLLVLGYVVIPASFHPARPLEIYWNDRSLRTTLRP
jgi:hypothetical protein